MTPSSNHPVSTIGLAKILLVAMAVGLLAAGVRSWLSGWDGVSKQGGTPVTEWQIETLASPATLPGVPDDQ